MRAARRRPRIQDVFKKDDHVIVQVNKEERYKKGASLTTNVSLAGRYLVLMPGTDLCGVSRKIEDEDERKKLKDILKQLKLPQNMGFIIRTAGMGRTKTELVRDLEYLMKLWQSIEKNIADAPAPVLLHREHDLVIRAIREHYSPDISEILVDEKEVHKKVRDFFHQVMPRYEKLVKLYQEKRPLFNKYQLEEQVEQVYSKRIKLKSGGHIVIEPTEAMVTIDVNSGGATKEKDVEETAFRVNMEAAPEIARQLRLRDLGGIIVIDFIDMSQKKHRQEVEKALKAELRLDRAKTKVLKISPLGLVELSRQRLRSSLGTGEYLECPMCDGSGKVRSPEMTAVSVFRKIKSQLVRRDASEVKAIVPVKVAEYLLNNMRGQLVELENQYSSKINIVAEQHVSDKDITVSAVKEEIAETSELPAIKVPPEELTVKTDEQDSSKEEEKRPRTSARHRYRSKKRRGAQDEALGVSAQDSNPEDQSSVINAQISSLEIDAPTEQLKGTISGPASGSTPNERIEGSGNMKIGDTSAKEISEASEESNVSQISEHEADDSKNVTADEETRTPDKESPNDEDQKEHPQQRKSFLRAYLPFFQ